MKFFLCISQRYLKKNFKMKNIFYLLLGLFFISRFFFLADYPHFYDSPEYFRESISGSFFQSLISSHEAVHPVWLFLTQMFQKITPANNVWEISLVSAIFGLFSFLIFYFLVKRLFSEKIALLSLVPLIFFPHLWLIQTNVLHESLDSCLFLLGLLFFVIFLENKKVGFFFSALIFLSLAIFDFLGILIWSPVLIGLAVLKTKEKVFKNIVWGVFIIIISSTLAVFGLYKILSVVLPEPLERLRLLIFDYGGGGIFTDWNFLGILRMLRNDFLILFNGYSLVAILGGFLGILYLLKQKKYRVFIFILSFIAPFILTGKFWYGGLFGRYSILVAYPLALLLALFPFRKIYGVLMFILFFSFLPTFIAYQKTPISEIQRGLIKQINLDEDDLLILSDYQRPQLPYSNAIFINGDKKNQEILENNIEKRLLGDKKIFISQQAVDFPYWQYDGQQIHVISKGSKGKAQLKKFLEDKKLILVAEDKNYPLLKIYRINI